MTDTGLQWLTPSAFIALWGIAASMCACNQGYVDPGMAGTLDYFTPEAAPPFGGSVVTHADPISKRLAKPAYLATYTDPYFGSRVTRVSGDPGTTIDKVGGTWPSVCRNNYSKKPVWNADMSVMLLSWGCQVFLDGQTYQPLFTEGPPGHARFHPTDPEVMIYLDGDEIGRWNLFTKEPTVLRRFPGYDNLSFELEGNLSGDGNVVAPVADAPNGDRVVFAYDIENDAKFPDIPIPSPWDWASISYTGKHVVINANFCNDNSGGTRSDRLAVYDSGTGRPVGDIECGYGLPSHADFTIDENGDDVHVGIAKDGPHAWDHTIMRRLRDGAITPLGPSSSHTGARNTGRPGWAYLQNPGGVYDGNEVVAMQATHDTGDPAAEI